MEQIRGGIMKKIDVTSINFDKVVKINDDISSESAIYHDNKMVYKIYKNFSIYELIEREAHVEEASKITNLRVATPLAKLYNGYSFCGCTMAYKKGITLSEYEKTHSIEELKDKLIDVSLELEEIHRNRKKIVLGDINYNNVMIDEENNDFSFIDFDGVGIKRMEPMTISAPLFEYLENRGIDYQGKQNYDRLAYLLAFYQTVFHKSIDEVSEDEFEMKTDELPFLNRSRYDFKVLKKKNKTVKDMPYFHEVFSK